MKKRYDSSLLAKSLTQKDLVRSKKVYSLINQLGLDIIYDENVSQQTVNNIKIPSGYKSIQAYEADKKEALLILSCGDDLPKELFNKLLAARKELENK